METEDALVAAAAELQIGGIERLVEASVHQDIYVLEDGAALRVGLELLDGVAGVAPDVLTCGLADGTHEGEEFLGIVERVAARESHSVQKRVGVYLTDDGAEAVVSER